MRPVVVNEAAPVISGAPQSQRQDFGSASGATGMFRVGKQAEIVAQQSVAQPAGASRRVPQWVFLGHLFNNIILGRHGRHVGQRIERQGERAAARLADCGVGGMPGVRRVLCGLVDLGNRSLEQDALTAAQSIPAQDVKAGALPTLGSLQQLENLRQSLEKLDGYQTDGPPYRLRWGLYQGDNMYPEVRRLYYAKFRALRSSVRRRAGC